VLTFVVSRTEKVNYLTLWDFIELGPSFSCLESLFVSHCSLFNWRKYRGKIFLKGS